MQGRDEKLKHLLFLAVCLAVFFPIAASRVSRQPYFYDEADYMYAVSLGAAANYLDEPARSFPEFVRTGLERRDSNRAALSADVRQQIDVNFYRHWHGPLYYYWLLLAPSHWDEHAMRLWSLVLSCSAIVLANLGLLWILPPESRTLGAVLGTSLFAFSHAVMGTAELAPHALFALCYLGSLFCAAKAVLAANRNFWYGAAVFAGLAFATLEVTFTLILALLATVWIYRTKLGTGISWMLRPASVFCLTAVVVWPGAVLKLAFLKAYLFMAYLAVFRKNAWGGETFWSTWAARLTDSPVEWLLIVLAVILFFRYRRMPGREAAMPFLFHAAFMMLATIRVNTSGARYMLPFVPALSVFAGIVLSRWLTREAEVPRGAWRGVIPILICGLLIGRVVWWNAAHPQQPDARPAAVLVEIRGYLAAHQGAGSRVIGVPQGELPGLHYYFPLVQWRGYTDDTTMAELVGTADAVLEPGNPVRLRVLKSSEK